MKRAINTFKVVLVVAILCVSQDSSAGHMMMLGHVPSISPVGSGTGTTTATIPAHAVGDLIVIFAFRSGSTTAPSLPGGYTSLGTKSGTSCSARLGYKIATSTSDTSGTWTNATQVVATVYRATGGILYVGNNGSSAGTTNTLTYAADTLIETKGTSLVAGFVGHRSTDQNLTTAPTGMANFASIVGTASVAAANSTTPLTSWSSTNVSLTGTASGWISWVAEIVLAIQTPGGWDIQNVGGISNGQTLPLGLSFSNGDKTLQQVVTNPSDVTSVDTVSSGKKYFEATFDSVPPATFGSIGTQSSTGFTYWDMALGNVGTDQGTSITGWSYTANGTITAVAIDVDNGLVWFRNVSVASTWNNSGTANPATGTGGLSFTTGGANYIVFGASSGGLLQMTLNTGKSAFAGTVPTGFSAWAP